ncbi:armadillo-type protein [Mycena capillaripes]|nr:armadillo-type protein [Mycena capillaripes]
MPITRFQQTMCVTATALLEHDDSRALVLTPEVIRKITARLGDSDASVQMAALVTLTAFLKHVLVATPETFQEIIAMPTTLLQGIVRVTLTALLGHDNSRALVSIPEVIRKITSRLGDSDASVQMVPLVALNVLLEHDDSCQVVSTPEILLKITALLTIPVSDIQLMALDSLQTFMSHDHSRPLVSKAVTIQDITALLDDSSDCVTRKALTTLRSFAGHNDLRGSILTPETIKKIAIFMNTRNMWNPSSLKKALIALESLKLLLEHDDTRASVLKALKIQDIICMLGHSGVPRGMVLDTLRIFLAHTDSRASLSESIQEIFTQLDDFHGENRIVARQTLEGLLQLDDVCALISSTPQLWQAMIGTFTFRDSDVMVILSCSLEYHDFVVAFSTPDSLANMVAMISRSWMDSYFLRFIGRDLIKRHTNIAPICNIIIHEVLQRITHSDASVRRCFIKLILMLPVTYTILSDNLTQLLLVLANMDSAIVGNAAEMIIHFTANDQFRASFAQMNIWELCLGLLRRHDTAPAALSIVAAFAQYENTRAQIINSHRNIANEFLNMMRAGSTDFQKWSIGVKGLLALGLF